MKIKTKIRLGLIFLLAIIIALASTGSYYINMLADISVETLKNNYETLRYAKNMIQAMDEENDSLAIARFEENLEKQEQNITETGENITTGKVRSIFEQYKTNRLNREVESKLRKNILNIQEMNMQAIAAKNKQTSHTTKLVFAYITMLGTLCFLLSFTFVINFPGMIANPILELITGIKAIANKNYSSRLAVKSNDEFKDVVTAFNEMAERLQEFEHSSLNQLKSEKTRIEAIINNMKDGIIGLDENAKILFLNSVAVQLLGIHEGDALNKYAPDVALRNDLLRTLLANDPQEKKLLKIFADNKESYFNKERLEIFSKDKKIGEVIMLRNITQFQELDVAKTNFIATISHELKTPLSSMKMSLRLLNDERTGHLNQEQKNLTKNLKSDLDRLLRLTAELLDMAQVESGNIHLDIRNVNPLEIVQQAININQFQLDQKNMTVQTDFTENLPTIKADADKTSWVLQNFLSNAIHYSPPNSTVTIALKIIGPEIEFSVTDSGIGIEEKYLDKVFEKFFQVPGSAAGGSGMGLAISKAIIEKQNGMVGVVSEWGKGSKFYFRLPL